MAGRGEATTWAQRLCMLEWLDIPANFKLITGDASSALKSVVAGTKLKKTDAYNELASHVNMKCGTNWTKASAESRYRAYLKAYKETKRALANGNNEKFCLGPADISKGIDTIQKKIDILCPYFDRMDTIFGSKQNVIPSHVAMPARPTQLAYNSFDDLVLRAAEDDDDEDSSSSERQDNEELEDDVDGRNLLQSIAYDQIIPPYLSSTSSSFTHCNILPSFQLYLSPTLRRRDLIRLLR